MLLEDALEDVTSRIQEARIQLALLLEEEVGIRRALDRHQGERCASRVSHEERVSSDPGPTTAATPTEPEPPRTEHPDPLGLCELPRTQAIEAVLEMFAEAVSPKAITAKLREVGRDDSFMDVGSTLQYLRKKGRAQSVGWASWVRTTEGSHPGAPLTEAPMSDPASLVTTP